MRRAQKGNLLEQNTWGCRAYLHSMKFEAAADSPVTSAVLAQDVKDLQFRYLAYKKREVADPSLLEGKVRSDRNLVPIDELEPRTSVSMAGP